MVKKSSEEILEIMIRQLLIYIEELFEDQGERKNEFQYGQRTAYTECLGWIQMWKYAGINGLNFDIEQKYPL